MHSIMASISASRTARDGNPVVHRPGVSVLDFGSRSDGDRIPSLRLDAKLDWPAAAIEADERVRVAVLRAETRKFPLARHWELRPDHAGRLLRSEYRSEACC